MGEQGQVIVRPLVESIVRMPEEIMLVLKRGEKNRKTAGTDWVSFYIYCEREEMLMLASVRCRM